MKKNSFPCLVLVIGLSFAVVFVSCSSTKPMTEEIHKQASRVGDVRGFQYYVSRNIVLTSTDDPVITGKVKGTGNIDVSLTKNIIQITTSEEGELLKAVKFSDFLISDENTFFDPNFFYSPALKWLVYYVAFEKENDNCLLFVKRYESDDKFYLLYDNDTMAINYGGVAYLIDWGAGEGFRAKLDNFFGKMKGKVQRVTTDDENDPYLLVKMNEKVKEKENYRKASGRKVRG
jgi:hypothetical protein